MARVESLQEEKMIEHTRIEEVEKPPRLVCNGMVVNMYFSKTGKDLSFHLINYFKELKKG